jgi:hypothetical protein
LVTESQDLRAQKVHILRFLELAVAASMGTEAHHSVKCGEGSIRLVGCKDALIGLVDPTIYHILNTLNVILNLMF